MSNCQHCGSRLKGSADFKRTPKVGDWVWRDTSYVFIGKALYQVKWIAPQKNKNRPAGKTRVMLLHSVSGDYTIGTLENLVVSKTKGANE